MAGSMHGEFGRVRYLDHYQFQLSVRALTYNSWPVLRMAKTSRGSHRSHRAFSKRPYLKAFLCV